MVESKVLVAPVTASQAPESEPKPFVTKVIEKPAESVPLVSNIYTGTTGPRITVTKTTYENGNVVKTEHMAN